MNSAELLQTLCNLTKIPKPAIREVLETAGELVAEVIHTGGEDVSVPGFGKFKPVTSPIRLQHLNFRDPPDIRLVGGKRRARFVPSKTFQEGVAGAR
jgi:nucleoid DNA-binding protein